MRYRGIQHIKDANSRAEQFWFSPDSLRFFNSRVYPTVYHGHYFITSESPDRAVWDSPRYTVRFARDNGHIATVGEFMAYKTLELAAQEIEAHYSAHSVNGEVPDSLFR